jgi:hypothetical protein
VVATPYSGTATRAAHFKARPAAPGINTEHFHPDPEPDPFNPQPDVPRDQAGTVLSQEQPFHSDFTQPSLAAQPITHWYNGQAPVASGVETASRMQAMQERMMVDHSDTNFVPDTARLHQHATEGQSNEWQIGRMSQWAGETIPDGPLAGLANGHNSYDQTNAVTEVYGGADPANVGRYRLGVKTNVRGLYENPLGKFGQEAMIHPYTGLQATFPVDKPRMENTAPYTPNSTGTSYWAPAQPNQVPSRFSLPAETAVTDYSTLNSGSDFEDRTGGFI